MKKIVFTIYMTLLFSLMVIANPAQGARATTLSNTGIAVKTLKPGISAREAKKLRTQQRHVNRIERRSKADGVITPRERRTIRRPNRNLNQNIRRERRDLNRH